jgi:hypothetical protein
MVALNVPLAGKVARQNSDGPGLLGDEFNDDGPAAVNFF